MINYLQVENLVKSIGDRVLFENISFTINKGEKVALVARNGIGKTTLLNIIAGYDSPDSGNITLKNNLTLGFLPQVPSIDESKSVLEEVLTSSGEATQAVLKYEKAMETGDHEALQKASEYMDKTRAWDFEVRMKQILTRLNIIRLDQPVRELSGGQKKRIALAKVLVLEPDFLILDEPTNHLDLDMIEWLEEYLERSNTTLFMVTHDRYFLNRVCNQIFEMDQQALHHYRGNYEYFLQKREERLRVESQEVDKAKNLFRKELDWMQRMPKARGTKAKSRVDAFYDIQDKASQTRQDDQVRMDVQTARMGKKIMHVDQLTKTFDDNTVIDHFTYTFNRFEKAGIVGKNGTGKTTFLNLITGEIQPDEGVVEVGQTIRFGYYKQDGMQFDENAKVIDIAREVAEVVTLGDGSQLSVSQFLTYFLFPHDTHYNYVYKLSGGEKRRLYLMTVLMQNPNFLILDEPTNDLDILTLNVLEDYLQQFSGCAIIVSHDRYFMDKLVDHLFVFEGNGQISDFPGNYTIYQEEIRNKEKQGITKSTNKDKKGKKEKPKSREKRLSYKEKYELEELEKEIEKLEQEKEQLEKEMSSGKLEAQALLEKSNRLSELGKLIDEKSERWFELSEKNY